MARSCEGYASTDPLRSSLAKKGEALSTGVLEAIPSQRKGQPPIGFSLPNSLSRSENRKGGNYLRIATRWKFGYPALAAVFMTLDSSVYSVSLSAIRSTVLSSACARAPLSLLLARAAVSRL